ncbi:hypothetical protein V1511DRAFT_461045 [Dipodascopsis uninucleata]
MDSHNRLNNFDSMQYEDILQWYKEKGHVDDFYCFQYHTWSIATAKKMFYEREFVLCVKFCQQRLEHSPMHLYHPVKNHSYWTFRQKLVADIRDSQTPDYYKLNYILYQMYSHAKLGNYIACCSQAIHALQLVHSMIARLQADKDYIVEFSVEKKISIEKRLLQRSESILKFLVCTFMICQWMLHSRLEVDPKYHLVVNFDFVYDAAKTLSQLVGCNVCAVNVLDDYIHVILKYALTSDITLSNDILHVSPQSDMIFPSCPEITEIVFNHDTDEVVIDFWSAKFMILCSVAHAKQCDLDYTVFRLGIAIKSLTNVYRASEVSMKSTKNLTMFTHSHKFGEPSGFCDGLDMVVAVSDMTRQELVGELVDIDYVKRLLNSSTKTMRKFQRYLRENASQRRERQKAGVKTIKSFLHAS